MFELIVLLTLTHEYWLGIGLFSYAFCGIVINAFSQYTWGGYG